MQTLKYNITLFSETDDAGYLNRMKLILESILSDRFSTRFDTQSPDLNFVLLSQPGRPLRFFHALLKLHWKIGFKGKLILISMESMQTVDLCSPRWGSMLSTFDYTICHTAPSKKNIHVLPLFYIFFYTKHFTHPHLDPKPTQKKTKFCHFLYSNPWAAKRIEFCKELMQYKSVDCPGAVLNNLGQTIPKKETIPFMDQYRFSISFENAKSPWYISEKIIRALSAGNIPIYWGSPEVKNLLNPKSFIYVDDYPSFKACIEHIKEVDRNPKLYAAYRSHNTTGNLNELLAPEHTHTKACAQLYAIAQETLQQKKPLSMEFLRCRMGRFKCVLLISLFMVASAIRFFRLKIMAS